MVKSILPVIIFVILIAMASIYFYSFHGIQQTESGYSICNTKKCLELAESYKATLNFSVSPCDDFFTFTCGILNDKTEIPADRAENLILGNLVEETELKKIGLLKQPKIGIPKDALETAKVYFQSCVNSEHMSKDEIVGSVVRVLNKIGGMPMMANTEYNSSIKYVQRIARMHEMLESSTFIRFSVHPDLKNVSARIPQFSQTKEFLLPVPTLTGTNGRSQALLQVYKTYINNVLCYLINCDNDVSEVAEGVEEIVHFETELAKINIPQEHRKDYFSQYKRLTIKEMNQKFPKIPWLQYVNEIFKEVHVSFDENDVIGYFDEEYFSKLGDLLEKTDDRIIGNYIGWKAITDIPVHLSPTLRSFRFELLHSLTGINKMKNMEEICSRIVARDCPLSLGKLFIDKYFPSEIKDELKEFMKYLRISLKKMLLKNKWMDDVTRQEALHKLEKVIAHIGYPDWLKGDALRLEHEEGLEEPFNRTAYVDSVLKLKKQRAKKMLLKFKESTDREAWATSPATVNAYYDPQSNRIIFPAGILQPPLVQLNSHKSVNYGAVGSVIGHEITHGFDNKGNQFDENGNLRNWWTNKTMDEFNKRKECFIDQYSNVIDEQTGLQLNGELTVAENIADNGGLRAAYEAYMIASPHDERLPGLEQLSHKQLFFIANTRGYCGKFRTQALQYLIMVDEHSPTKYRAFLPATNYKEFAEAFGCAVGSTMNPVHKCELW